MKITLKSTGESVVIPELAGMFEVLNSKDSKLIIDILIKNKNKLFKKYRDKSLTVDELKAIKNLRVKFGEAKRVVNTQIWDEIKKLNNVDHDKVFKLVTSA